MFLWALLPELDWVDGWKMMYMAGGCDVYTGRWSRESSERRPQAATTYGTSYQRYNERRQQYAWPFSWPHCRTYVCVKHVFNIFISPKSAAVIQQN